MTTVRHHLIVVAFLAALGAGTARANVSLPALFCDNMVVQQGMEVPVWGWAGEGEEVTVSFQGQKASTKAVGGKWKVALAKQTAGGPFEMTVSGKNTITIKSVLVGEVWVCGGQSNMAFLVRNSAGGDEAIAKSANPKIRLFKVGGAGTDSPAKDVKGKWEECGPESAGAFTAAGYYFGRDLQKALGVPVGLIESCIGGTNVSSWIRRDIMESTPAYKHYIETYEAAVKAYPQAVEKHKQALAKHKEKIKGMKAKGESVEGIRAPQPPMGADNPKRPGAYYNGMIVPLQPYAIKGAIWYQGEANGGSVASATEYRDFFPAMIECWRKEWGQGDFPFLFVQLPGYNKGGKAGAYWPLLRESQLKTLSLKNTGMAVAIDVGELENIHPKKKQPVGERLALAARAVAYSENIVSSGPLYDSMSVDGAKAVLKFKNAGGGLMAKDGGALKGFTICAEDKNFVAAEAKIAGDTVVVSSPQVSKPVAVRYAWEAFPDCNLANAEGLPASPFRTDAFPIEEKAPPTLTGKKADSKAAK